MILKEVFNQYINITKIDYSNSKCIPARVSLAIILTLEIKFSTLITETVLDILRNTKTSKAAGLDNLPGVFLRDGAEILSTPITQLCNLSIFLSSFPNDCKTAKIVPLYKKGSKTDPKNYRPISLLPLLSKIVEKVIHDQTQQFLTENEILYRFQSGFRPNYSTDFCLSFLNDKIIKGFDSGLLTGMILIDLQKAFDTINYKTSFRKNEGLGFFKPSNQLV